MNIFEKFTAAKKANDAEDKKKAEKAPAHYTDHLMNPLSQRAIRRRRDREATKTSKRFYAKKAENDAIHVRAKVKAEVKALRLLEKQWGESWNNDWVRVAMVRKYVGTEDTHFSATAGEILAAHGITIDYEEV